MSGLEVLGAAGSVAGLLDGAAKLFTIARDIVRAEEEKQRFRDLLENLQEQLKSLRKLQNDAQGYPEQLYYMSLFQENLANPPVPGDQRGALLRIATSMKKMEHKLRKRSSRMRRLVQLKWTLDKAEVEELLFQIQEWRSQIQTVMQQDQLRLTMKILTLGKDTNRQVHNITTVTEETRQVTKNIALTSDETSKKTERIETLAADTQGLTQGIAATGDRIVERTKRIEDLGVDTQGVTQGIAVTSNAIDDRTQKLEVLGAEYNDRLRSIQEDSLALRLRKENKDKKDLHRAIADWVSRLNFGARHTEIYDRHVDITQEFIESPEFRAWSSGRPWVLYCWADAGAGKTMLSSIVIEYLRTEFAASRMPVLCIYLNHKEQNAQNPRALMGSLLKQLIQYRDYDFCSDNLIRRYKEKARGTGLSLKELQETLCSEITHYERVFVIVDALDEGSDEVRQLYADILLGKPPLDRLCIMVTSREAPPDADRGITCDICDKRPLNIYFRCQQCIEYDICYECKDIGEDCGMPGHTLDEPYVGQEVYKQVDPSEEAIREFVRKQIHSAVETHRPGRAQLGLSKKQAGTTLYGRLSHKDSKIEADIVDRVCARSDRKFLLAKLYVETLKVKLNKREAMDTLQALPPGYAGVYETTMERIKAYSVNDPRSNATQLSLTVLSWVVFARRPLDLPELQHALAIRLDRDFSEDDSYDEEEILKYTAGLVGVAADNGAVRVSHYTVQEYFMDDGKHWLPQDANTQIARACLHYMSIGDLSTPCNFSQEEAEFEERKKQYPFMCYAYEYWGHHARDAMRDRDVTAQALRFLKNPELVATLVQGQWYLGSAEASKWEIRRGANALHVAAWFGLTDVLDDLLEDGLDINAKDPFHEQTPLIYASRRGHSDTVAKLVQLGAYVNNRSARGRTALVEAVAEGHRSVVEILLQQYRLAINEIQPWDFGRSVLMLAVIRRDLEIVNALLPRSSVNQKDSKGFTALMLAASFGFVEIVDRLLAHPEIDVNVTSIYGKSALFHAAVCENDGDGRIVRMLLDHGGIDTSIRDKQGGGTALIRAVECGNPVVVGLLLERTAEVDQKDYQGRGLLHAAAINDQREIASFLLDKQWPIDAKDKQNRTPLHDAARCGSEAMIQLLLERGADAGLKDASGRSPATVAWQNGKTTAYELLQEVLSTESSPLPDPESLPVWSLAKLGRADIIERKIAQRTTNPYILSHLDPDTDDTPIHCAISASQPAILRILLSAGLSPDTQNAEYLSPLHVAASALSLELLQILLSESPNLNLNPKDETGTTPLFLAYTSNLLPNALTLVEAGAEIEEKAVILPLFFAAVDYNRIAAVKVLMKKHKAPILAKNKRGESALQIAKARGLVEIQRLLDGNKSYANNRSLALEEGEELDLTRSVRGPFTRPEVWEEGEEEELV
ncbi:MAG: hypothetical protein Q9207_004099 [Kuettlingeria erythrocarpa]